jgi:Ca2+-binding RTX toxin-like protein
MVDITLTEGADYVPVTGFEGVSEVTRVFGLGGGDYFSFSANVGSVSVFMGDGNDFFIGSGINGGSGNPIGSCIYRIYGENGNDYIAGSAYSGDSFPFYGAVNFLDGGAGDDTIISRDYNDTVRGGNGNDWIEVYRDGIAWGDGGNDTILGARYFTQLLLPLNARGNAGDDVIYGSETGRDTLSGDEGVDILVAGNNSTWLYTGADGGVAYGGGGFDVLVGASDSDTLSGGNGNDIAYGYAGRDWLYGGTGNDTLLAGDGDDVLVGGDGTNWLDGGAGNDVFITIGAADQIFTGDGHNYVYGYATAGGVIVTGGSGIDEFVGGNGASNDTVTGLGGNDYLFGGAGNDLLQGGADNDVLIGQAGNDTLEGGAGVNLLWANDAGNDQILVNVADGGTQVVEFFEAGGTNDVVRLLGSNLTSFAGIQNLINNISTLQNSNFLTNAGSGAQLILGVGTATQTAIWFQGVSAYSLTAADFLFG